MQKGFSAAAQLLWKIESKQIRLSVAELAVIFDSLQSQFTYLFDFLRSRLVQDTSVERGENYFQGKVSSQ